MKITNIKAQVKNKDRLSIYVDEKYSFSVSVWQLSGSGIKVGLEVDKKELEDFKKSSDFGKIYDRTLRWAYMRLRSEYEIDQYLRRLVEDPGEVTTIKAKLSKSGLIDDYKFSESWVRSRRRSKLASSRKLWAELKQKGIADSVIDRVIKEDESTDNETLQKLIEKKRRITRYQDDQKLTQYLVRQGYSYTDVKKLIED